MQYIMRYLHEGNRASVGQCQPMSDSDIYHPIRHLALLPHCLFFARSHYTLLFALLQLYVLSRILNNWLLSIHTHSPLGLRFKWISVEKISAASMAWTWDLPPISPVLYQVTVWVSMLKVSCLNIYTYIYSEKFCQWVLFHSPTSDLCNPQLTVPPLCILRYDDFIARNMVPGQIQLPSCTVEEHTIA